MARKRLGEILIEAGVLDESRLRTALQEQQRWGGRLGRALLEMRMVSETDLVQALSRQLHIPIAPNLDTTTIPRATLDLVSLETCQEHAIMPFRRDGKFLDLALVDPTNLSILDAIRIRTKLNVRPFIIGPYQLEKALARHLQGAGSGDAATPSGAMRAAMSDPSVVGSGNGAR